MKRTVCLSLLSGLLLLSACQSGTITSGTTGTQTGNESANISIAPFNTDYNPEDNLDFYTQPESLQLLASGGPYYISPQTLPMPAFAEYGKLKQAKVDEAMSATDALIAAAKDLSGKIRNLETGMFTFLGTAVGEDKAYGSLTTGNVDERAHYASKETIINSYIDSLPQNPQDPYSAAASQYQKSMLALQLGETVLDDFTSFSLNAAQVADLSESSSNETIKAALSDFNTAMSAMKDAQSPLETIVNKSKELDTGLRQLDTAEYYMAQTAVGYLQSEIPKAKDALASVKTGTDFTDDDKTFATSYLSAFETMTSDLAERLGKLKDKDQLLLSAAVSYVPAAHADFWSAYESAKSTLSSGASAVGSGLYTAGQFGWDATRTVYHGAQRVVGATVEGAGTITKSTFDFYSGLYYGNSLADIKQRQDQNYGDWWDKTKNGTAGAETLKLGVDILDTSESVVSDIVTAPIKYTWGEGYVSWAIGGVAKLGAGVFTGLGKGIFKVANPKSSADDIFWGTFDIGTSLIGGSSSVVKASQVTEAGAKTGKNLIDQGANYLARLFGKSKAAKLAERMEEINALLKEGGLEADVSAALKKELKQSRYEINRLKNVEAALEDDAQALKKDLEAGAGSIKENTKELVAKNVKDQAGNIQKMFNEDIESSVTGYLKKFIDPIKSPADIFDNYLHGEFDKWLAGKGKDFVTNYLIPWLSGGFDGVYSGTWSSRGMSFPVVLNVKGSDISGSGTITTGAGGVSAKSTLNISGTIDSAGNISGKITQSVTVNGVVTGGGGGSGSFSGNIKDKTMTMNYSGSGSATISTGGYSTSSSGTASGTVILTRQ